MALPLFAKVVVGDGHEVPAADVDAVVGKQRWARRDSNPRHLPCKGSALAN
jgi:hypothetical protein